MDDETTGDLGWRRRQGWVAVGLPPAPVLALSGIVTFFLLLTWRMDEYGKQLRRRAEAGLWLLLLFGLLALAALAHHALFDAAGGRLVVVPTTYTYWWQWGQQSDGDGGGGGTSPWAVAAVVALLLVLASHKPSFHVFRPPSFYHK